MKRLYLILFIVFVSIDSFTQNSFPKSWIGDYEGNLEIYAVDSLGMQLKMKLSIQPTLKDSTFQWVITYYFKEKEDVRKYELKIVDTKTGHYQIDEKNSIVIDGYYKYGIFTSYFEVNENVIIASYTKEANTLVFEIISASSVPISETGGATDNDKKIPDVYSYIVNGRQRAILQKAE